MAAEITFERFDYRPEVEGELRRQRGIGDALRSVADDAANAARMFAPVRTGAYRASIASSVERSGDGYEARAGASVPYALFIEYGTNDTPAFSPLRKGIAAAGIRRSVI